MQDPSKQVRFSVNAQFQEAVQPKLQLHYATRITPGNFVKEKTCFKTENLHHHFRKNGENKKEPNESIRFF